jgi:hypothetical protein
MVTLLITSIVLLGFLIVVLYFWQKPNTDGESNLLPPPAEPRGLFTVEESADFKRTASSIATSKRQQETAALLERAASGDKNALREAYLLNDRQVYDQVLDSLTDSADTEPKLLALVSFITRAELRVNTGLAREILESWKRSPDRGATAKTLHIVALANDASLYNETVLAAMQFWREGRLPDTSPEELRSLFEGEFWLLSSKVRSSGAGFVLKRTLARVRREFEATTPINR